MSYMLLIVEPVGQRRERSDDEGRGLYDSMLQFADGLKARGVLLAAQSLRSDEVAVRVSERGGRRTLVDGPFAEAKEMVGGFFLLDVPTRAQAVEIAARMPGCTLGNGRSARARPVLHLSRAGPRSA